jgi:hypothetical protein
VLPALFLRQEEGEKGVLCLVRRGGRRNSKRKERLKRRKTNDFNTKKTDKSKITNTQENVCNFNIKFFGPKCPPYNIQNNNL